MVGLLRGFCGLVCALIVLGGVASAQSKGGDGGPENPLRAGLASVDVTPEVGVPLAGFGGGARRIVPFDLGKFKYCTFLRPSTGVLDPIRSKVLILKKGDQKLVFISLDVVGVTANFNLDIKKRLKRLGFTEGEVFISATHTHSGPGTLSSELVWELLAADSFQPAIYQRFLDGVILSVEKAYDALEPATLYSASFKAEGLQRNRRHHDGLFDPTANELFVWADRGEWLGAMINVAVHGTAYGTNNHQFSADMPGGLERALEARLASMGSHGATALFINGAEGDVSPLHGGDEGIRNSGIQFADQSLQALSTSAKRLSPEWSVKQSSVHLGMPGVNLKACSQGKKIARYLNRHLSIPLGHALPHDASISMIDLGGLTLMTWPGEPTTLLGLALKETAVKAGAESPWILGLTNGYMAYFVTEKEFSDGGYEPCSNLYGPRAGSKIIDAYRELLKQIRIRPSI